MKKTKNQKDIRERLMRWYQAHHRNLPWRKSSDPYHIWVSEVMLQQTQVKTVLGYYEKFLRRFPDVAHLAQADLQEVLKIWEGLGYYARARNLHRAAKVILAEHGGNIPDERNVFEKLPGVGDYIASAVQSIAFHQPHAVADGNVKRVLARLFQIDSPVNKASSHKIFKETATRLLDVQNPGDFNQALMELGALVCKPGKPECEQCPIPMFCTAYQKKETAAYPKRIRSEPVPEYHIAAGIVFKDQQVLILQRKPEGLLGGLWEFPGGKVKSNEDAEHACVREVREKTNLIVKADAYLTRVKHAYTHFKIFIDVFRCSYVSGETKVNEHADYRWINLSEAGQYPFSKSNHKMLPMLGHK